MLVSFVIPTAPRGKERPRLGKIVYTPVMTQVYENFVKGCYVEQCGNVSFEDRPVAIYIKAYMPILTKYKKAEKEAAARGELIPISKPDVDNIMKAILDALNKIAYNDDETVYRIMVEKIYSLDPRTEVILSDEKKIPDWEDFVFTP